ncbi:MAG: ATP-dependent helicase [Lachnospiraceae bacterium]|nr:ATP-dependent helicase [Lachnospiraceae bacterium]
MHQLNNEQQRAVAHRDGPMLVLAGPGSGKTSVLVNRVKRLIEVEKTDPHNILVLTFSKLAAEEMHSRFDDLVSTSYPVTFGTFHAVFYHILKRQGLYRTGEILTRNKKIELLKITAGRKGLKPFMDISDAERMVELIGYRKMGDKAFLADISGDDKELLEKLYDPYVLLCKKEGLIDFDDMINDCLKALKSNSLILNKWQERYRYILVDEFQDIDLRQYEVMKLLAGKDANIFCVGDDDQSIYSFRGAQPEVMKRFVKDYPEAKQVKLKLNYRCPGEIISHAGRLISHNKDRFDKTQICINSDKVSKGDKEESSIKGYCIEHKCFGSVGEEAVYCINIIKRITAEAADGKYESIGVLYRNSRSVDMLEEFLKRESIPYTRKDRKSDFYDKDWVKDILAYIRFAYGEEEQLFRVLNKPYRGLVRESISHRPLIKEEVLKYYEGSVYLKEGYDACVKLFKDIEYIKGLNCYAGVNYILKGIGLYRYIENNYFADRSRDDIEVIIGEIRERARQYSTFKEWLADIERGSCTEKGNSSINNRIELMTIHGSKGLEFDNVFLIGLQEGLFPGKRNMGIKQMEEERRLFYVAMTRAKKRLWLMGIKRDNYGKRESRFIGEAGFKTETVGSIL